jgi:hypothetical protein
MTGMAPEVIACLPPKLHPISMQFLDLFLHGRLPLEEFRRLFSLPNSDYLTVTDCILRALDVGIWF